MENYKIYCNLKDGLKTKNKRLSEMKANKVDPEDIVSLEIDIEEDLNALNIIFNHLILQSSVQKPV